MRIFFSVGEPSGDLHASNLIKEIRQRVSHFEAVGFGGPRMQKNGCEIIHDLTQMGVMFVADAVRNYRFFLKLVKQADEYFSSNQVDAVVLIDYPGFNWWIARKAKEHNIPVFYYGVPQMWAWASWRINKIKKFVDHVICKLPFEQKWFAQRGCQAIYVGHPYFDQLNEQQLDQALIESMHSHSVPTVLLLPGSRPFELSSNLETLIRSGTRIRDSIGNCRLVVGCLNRQHADKCRPQCEKHDIEVYAERTQELMSVADACIACSGSVSLELLHHRVPTVIVYKVAWWKMVLQSVILKCKYITLTNLMNAEDIRKTNWWPYDPDAADAEPVLMPEFLSHRDRSESVAAHVVGWLNVPEEKERVRNKLDELAVRYAKPGATHRAATYIISKVTDVMSEKAAA